MTTVAESPRKAEGRRRRTTVTPSLPQPGTVPLCPSLLLQHPAEQGGVGWGGVGCGPLAVLCPECSLSLLHLASSSVGSSLLPAPVGTSVALGSPQNPLWLARTSQFPGKPLTAQAGQEANIFVSSGTRLQEPGFPSVDTSPSSPSAGPARCSAISQHCRSRPVGARLPIETKPPLQPPRIHTSSGPLYSP